jgi:hypothetical protein
MARCALIRDQPASVENLQDAAAAGAVVLTLLTHVRSRLTLALGARGHGRG